jgi:tetratricopeptide (TPR) repeat protein
MAKSQELLGKAGLALRGRQFSESAELFEEAAAALQQEGATVKERGALLGAAEARWQLGEKDVALDCYDRALKNAVDAADQSGEAHVLLGKGFALMSIGDSARAIESLERSAALTESCGHAAQHQFVLELLQQAKNITGSGHSTADVHTQEASGSRSNSMDGQPLLAVSLAEGETIKKTRSGQPPGGYAVKLAFARSMMSKGPVVLVRPLPVPEQLATEHAPEVCEEHAAGNFVMCIQLKSERRQVMKGSPESPACNFR